MSHEAAAPNCHFVFAQKKRRAKRETIKGIEEEAEKIFRHPHKETFDGLLC
jgi:hypothetical protein